MYPLDSDRIGAQASSFEARCVQQGVIERDQTFSNTIGDTVKVTRAQLVRYQTVSC